MPEYSLLGLFVGALIGIGCVIIIEKVVSAFGKMKKESV